MSLRVADYIRDTRGELRHVAWPSRRQVAAYTAMVIAGCFAMAAILGAFDLVFSEGLKAVVGAPTVVPAPEQSEDAAAGSPPMPSSGESAPPAGNTPQGSGI
jgi:preprotein translocase SecE subunit